MPVARNLGLLKAHERAWFTPDVAQEMKRRFVDENNDYGEMDTGETTLAFASNSMGEANLPGGFRKNNPSEPPAGVEIALVAEDVGYAYRSAVEAGSKGEAEPKTKPWGQTVAYVRDPDGVLVEIGSRV